MKSLGTRLALLIVPILLVGTTGLVGLLTARESTTLVRYQTREAQSTADGYAAGAGQRLSSAIDVARTLAVILSQTARKDADRERSKRGRSRSPSCSATRSKDFRISSRCGPDGRMMPSMAPTRRTGRSQASHSMAARWMAGSRRSGTRPEA